MRVHLFDRSICSSPACVPADLADADRLTVDDDASLHPTPTHPTGPAVGKPELVAPAELVKMQAEAVRSIGWMKCSNARMPERGVVLLLLVVVVGIDRPDR